MSPTRRDDPPAIRIEVENEWAWCGDRRLQLAPRVFAVLRYLVDRRGRLVTKEELLTAVWRDAVVSDAALASGIRDVRKALEDSSAAPRYVQTVHRRGFRFIGPVAEPTAPVATVDATARKVGPRDDPSARVPRDVASLLVGREAELSRLHARLERALGGQRQLVFVTGEPGIGKSALVKAFCADAGKVNALRVGWGQCVEQYGAGEAYLPVLEALGRLGRAAGGERLVQVLKQHAPTWLEHLPALLRAPLSAARSGFGMKLPPSVRRPMARVPRPRRPAARAKGRVDIAIARLLTVAAVTGRHHASQEVPRRPAGVLGEAREYSGNYGYHRRTRRRQAP
jgi:DNA-binding winged helix-turn-helix (wHTH) protein